MIAFASGCLIAYYVLIAWINLEVIKNKNQVNSPNKTLVWVCVAITVITIGVLTLHGVDTFLRMINHRAYLATFRKTWRPYGGSFGYLWFLWKIAILILWDRNR
jgi:hypothetical protein